MTSLSQYQKSNMTFDIKEAFDGNWAVILVPDLSEVSIGTGKYLGTFHSKAEAQQFCDTWNPESSDRLS